MSSGSLKDLSRAIVASAANPSLPLPDDLLEVIDLYLQKHATHDESDSQRLQEELLAIYQASILDEPSRLAPFLAFLQLLKPVLRGSGRLLQWWDKLSGPILLHVGVEKGLAIETRNTLLKLLVYDEDEESFIQDAQATSQAITESLLATWLVKTRLASEEFDDHAKFVEGQIQAVLMAFGKKRPKDFLTSIDKFFVKKDTRILTLSLLCEFFRHQPPHLHQMLSTPLFENLLRCLQIDTSTRVISLAMTALIMFLPHIPNSTSKHLPALFNIYTRMLFWDRERNSGDIHPHGDVEISGKSEALAHSKWDKLPYLLESEDESVPELLHYFTFLYGLYPINFMSYIRKPQRYLRHANFAGADDLDIQPTEIRQRSEPFRQVHLLHPNFFTLTIESEITDNNRFKRSEAADVVAECMALYVPSEDQDYAPRTGEKKGDDSDVPENPLLDDDMSTPYQSRHNSWRDTRSTAVASPIPPNLQRKASQTSQSMPSIADSPSLHASERQESPTIPPHMVSSQSHKSLTDLMNPSKSARGSIYQNMTNESVASLALSNTHEPSNIDAYLASLSRDTPRSPSLRPVNDPTATSLKVAYLNREIQLLKNDLNFERYLKQQHLSHIGQLRRKQIREARVEAETQNLLNSNRSLKVKLADAKQLNIQMKKEAEKSRTHSRKWEADLSAKLSILREEKKKWNLEREELTRDLRLATENVARMRQIIVRSESNELAAKQKVQFVEASHDEFQKLKVEVKKLNEKIRAYEGSEIEAVQAKENETRARAKVTMLEMELAARDAELEKSKRAFEEEISNTRAQNCLEQQQSAERRESATQELIDAALATSRNRINELQRERQHMLNRYTRLQQDYFALKEQVEDQDEEALLTERSPSPSPMVWRTEFESPNATQPFPPMHSLSLDEGISPYDQQWNVQHWQHSISGRRGTDGTAGTAPSQASGSTSKGSTEGEKSKGGKIKPESEVRIYGRGGVQNIGKKEKGKEKEEGEKKKEKKLGIKGLRAFGGSLG